MKKATSEQLSKYRLSLGNPYACLDGDGGYDGGIIDTPKHELISASRWTLQDPYAHLDGDGGFDAIVEQSPKIKPEDIWGYKLRRNNKRRGASYSSSDIEKVARDLQNKIWRSRGLIWPTNTPTAPIDILDPSMALKAIGYQHHLLESLGQHAVAGSLIEVAGLIDSDSKLVEISKQFSNEVRNFTAAHELGHSLLHNAQGLHRDRPLDGSTLAREPREIEADKFASYFLMPATLVQSEFEVRFSTANFHLNESTLFALDPSQSFDKVINKLTLRELSRILATSQRYNGVHFTSLAARFRVSHEAMAIRLEELCLVDSSTY